MELNATQASDDQEWETGDEQARLQAVVAVGRVGAWTWRIQDNTVEWDEALVDLLGGGYEASEPGGMPNAVHPDDRAQVASMIVRLLRENTDQEVEYRYRRPNDGRTLWVLCRAHLDLGPDGRPWRVTGACIDLTEHRKTKEALRRVQERFDAALTAGGIATWVWDLNADFVAWDAPMDRIFGRPAPDSSGGHFERWLADVLPADRELVRVAFDRALSRGTFTVSFRYVLPNRDLAEVRATGHVERTTDGAPAYVVGVVVDITELKRVERRIRAQSDVSRVLAESESLPAAAPDILATLGIVEDFAAAVLWDAPRESRILCVAGTWAAPGPFKEEVLARAMRKGEAVAETAWQRGEAVFVDDIVPDGPGSGPSPCPASFFCAFPLTCRDNIVGVIGLLGRRCVSDDTGLTSMLPAVANQIGLFIERKRAEEDIRRMKAEAEARVVERTAALQLANSELEAFSYSVSHDLRAPLRSMEGLLDVVLADFHTVLPEKSMRYLDMCRREAGRMQGLIEGLLTFSRLGRDPLKRVEIEMLQLVTECVRELTLLPSGRIQDVRVGPLPCAWGTPTLVKQVWMNLISNALKYSRNRAAAVIEIDSHLDGVEPVYFVRDNGTGFDMRYADKLFGVFQRLHSSQQYEGSGVGLAIAHRIICRHGGRIWANSEPDNGATFFFSLPSRNGCGDPTRGPEDEGCGLT